MREKLIEILADNATCIALGIKSCDECAYGRCEDCYTEALVDHLIANGVMVQECGHWNIIMDDYDCEMMQCSVCGSEFYDGDNDTVDCLHNYCPHCGAKMIPQPPKGE